MKTHPARTVRLSAPALVAAVLITAVHAPAIAAQDRPTLTAGDYGRFESLGFPTLSPDGRWVAYPISRVNGEDELRYRQTHGGDTARAVPYGSRPSFSADGRWLAYAVGVSDDERERLSDADEPVRLRAEVVELATGEKQSFDGVASFAFDAAGRYLALEGYPPDEPQGKGADLRVLDLASGVPTTFGNAGSYAWSDLGSLLAVAVATGAADGNGVQLYDAATGRLGSLDSGTSAYTRLAWRDDAADLAVLRSVEPAGEDETAYEALAWRGLDRDVGTPLVLDTTMVPDTLEVVAAGGLRWSPTGDMLAVGLRPPAESGPAADSADEERADGAEEGTGEPSPEKGDADEVEPADVQIWHPSDVRIFPQQRAMRSSDERRTVLAVWHAGDGRVTVVGSDLMEDASLVGDWTRAVERVAAPYPWGTMFGRRYHDLWRVDTRSGERERLLERQRYTWPSPAGRYVLSFDGEDYWSHELATGRSRSLTGELPTVFADTAYDTPTDLLPPHGFGSNRWLEGDRAVLLYDEFDVWRVAPDGGGAERITRGAEEQVIHRVAVAPDPDDEPGIDPRTPLYFHTTGKWTKREGIARARRADRGAAERLIELDRDVSWLARADSADVFVYRVQSFDDSPDLFVAGADADASFADARRVTGTNPFMGEYAWGRSELVDFTSESGRPLQAALLYPANYQPGRRYPTIVYTYEIVSPGVHQFSVPSERSYYNYQAWTQQGYAVLMPDIVYTPREPGISAIESVRAAVAKAVEMGVTDPEAVGLIGHSWGGYQAAFLPTRTDIFAAAVAGAPLTDFVSMMGTIHWNPGVPELDHWETGQARMEVPFWEDPDAHRRNSPIHGIQDLETPMMVVFGNEDGVVDWDQGTQLYNFARRAGKQVVLVVYEGEDHGFRQEKNQRDYHRRIHEWFGHYLKGEPAPKWITDGIPASEIEEEARRVAEPGGR